MITVSESWKNAHNELLLPETLIKVSYALSEPGIESDITTTGTDEISFSEADELSNGLDKTAERYNSLEWNFWGLDGSFSYYDESPIDPGYTSSSLADKNAAYTGYPSVTVRCSKVHTQLIPGITITWGSSFGEWASKFRVTAYNGDAQIAQMTIEENTSDVSQVWIELQNYDRIVVDVLEWGLPYRRCRISEIFVGIQEVYTKADMLSYSHSNSVDMLSAALPKNEISFSLDNSTDRWNPNNPTGVERYLLERQEIKVKYGMIVDGTTEWIKAGTFWLSEWNTPANGIEASFVARDATGFMNEVYTGIRAGTLMAIATAALEQAELPIMPDSSKRYYLDERLRSIATDFSDDSSEYKISDVLQLVAHAASCVFYQDRDGKIRIEPRNTVETDYHIGMFQAYTHPDFTISKPLKAVSVHYGEDLTVTVPANATGEVQTVANPLIRDITTAQTVANTTKNVLEGRKTLLGEYRADPRLDALDVITVESKYATNKVAITEITYSTVGGAMRGKYEGRVIA